jgi:hypothetical protein
MSNLTNDEVALPSESGRQQSQNDFCDNCGCNNIIMGFCDECGSLLEKWLINSRNLVEATRPDMESHEA